MTIKAIPWRYAGIPFRSKLEAKWFRAFQLLGCDKIEYEPATLQVEPPGENFCWYWTPDFLIEVRGQSIYVEIKPKKKFDEHDLKSIKSAYVCAFTNPALIIIGDPSSFVGVVIHRIYAGKACGFFWKAKKFVKFESFGCDCYDGRFGSKGVDPRDSEDFFGYYSLDAAKVEEIERDIQWNGCRHSYS